jgi:hypothetical protein
VTRITVKLGYSVLGGEYSAPTWASARMDTAKDDLIRADEMDAEAARILVEAGAVERCGVHDWVLIDQYDRYALRRAYAIGANLPNNGLLERDEIVSAIARVYKFSRDACDICRRVRYI